MVVLAQLNALGYASDDFKGQAEQQAKIKKDIYDDLASAYEDKTQGTGYYIPVDSFNENASIIWGGSEREKFIQEAQAWNRNIQKEFLSALVNLIGPVDLSTSIAPECVPMDDLNTWRMQCAARELNNSWWGDANHAVYAENSMGFPYFKVVLSDAERNDIITHPENWVMADLTVK